MKIVACLAALALAACTSSASVSETPDVSTDSGQFSPDAAQVSITTGQDAGVDAADAGIILEGNGDSGLSDDSSSSRNDASTSDQSDAAPDASSDDAGVDAAPTPGVTCNTNGSLYHSCNGQANAFTVSFSTSLSWVNGPIVNCPLNEPTVAGPCTTGNPCQVTDQGVVLPLGTCQ